MSYKRLSEKHKHGRVYETRPSVSIIKPTHIASDKQAPTVVFDSATYGKDLGIRNVLVEPGDFTDLPQRVEDIWADQIIKNEFLPEFFPEVSKSARKFETRHPEKVAARRAEAFPSLDQMRVIRPGMRERSA